MADKRIIELTEKATVDNSDYLIVDNSNGGTKKLRVSTLKGSLDGLKREVVQTLPTQDIDPNTIYMVPKQTAGTQNVYDEYMYINNAWEIIGSSEVDLSNYQTKTDNNLLTNSKQIVGGINELFQSVSSGKAEVASAITDKGVTTASDATFSQMATNISKIQTGIDLSALGMVYKMENSSSSGFTIQLTATSNQAVTIWEKYAGLVYFKTYINNTLVNNWSSSGEDSIVFKYVVNCNVGDTIKLVCTGDFSPSAYSGLGIILG